jgi:predicted porin
MSRRIATAAVAGLFAAPVAALAQSNLTISGFLKGGFENLKLNNFSSLRIGAETNKSQYGVVDDLSRIIFSIREDLGGGLAAIGQLDLRIKPDDSGAPTPATPSAGQNPGNVVSGNSHVGLTSKSWGRIFIGRQDLHYMYTAGDMDAKNSMRADSKALLVFAGTGLTAIAGATRTQNVVHYTTPNWSGFTGIIAFSSNPSAFEGDIPGANTATGTGTLNSDRKGRAWNLNPNYAAANWQVGYSYWNSKPDGGTAISTAAPATTPAGLAALGTMFGTANQVAHRLYGHYSFGFGLKIGLAVDWSKLKTDSDLGTAFPALKDTTVSKRTAWSIPFQYSFMNKHQITGHYTKAKSDSRMDDIGLNSTGANMWALGYAYDLSKRTSLGITYARIDNKQNASYNLYNSASLGLGQGGLLPGEDPRMFGTTIRHAF